jgi:hypothetical protein
MDKVVLDKNFPHEPMCQKTYRTKMNCNDGISPITFSIILFCFCTIQRINEAKTTVLVDTETEKTKTKKGNVYKEYTNDNSVIYISNKTIYVHGKAEEHASWGPKSPHERRRHERHYKSGKVVTIEPIQVHGGNKNKTYIVK